MTLVNTNILPKVFCKEDLIKAVRASEGPVAFPLGTVNGDVEYILNVLLEVGFIKEIAGGYECMTQ